MIKKFNADFAMILVLLTIFPNFRQDIWRWMNALALLPAGVLVLGSVLFVPESPRWLVSSGHPDQAYLLMRRLRSDSVGARAELEEIERIQAEGMRRGRIGLGAVMTERWLRNCTLIGKSIEGEDTMVQNAPW